VSSSIDADEPTFFALPSGLRMAYQWQDGAGPALVFLPGYMSDMAGGKATALFAHAAVRGRAALLLDYTGCGQSDGTFADGTLSRWRDEVWALIDHVVGNRPVVLMGSSMGGWLMLLMALVRPWQVAGLIGIAAAPDFTEWGYADAQKAEIAANGVVFEDNPYGPEPTPTFAGFWADGQANLLTDAPMALTCPVHLVHGQRDNDVPWELSIATAAALVGDDVTVTLIKDGDHRLSRDGDIAAIVAAYDRMMRALED
jgi:pimeloyl-ACP methyl ester carboxylesterase